MISEQKFKELEELPFAEPPVSYPQINPIHAHLDELRKDVTLFSVTNAKYLPEELLCVLYEEMNRVIEDGLTYPHHKKFTYEDFVAYWFASYTAILLEGKYESLDALRLASKSKEQFKTLFLGTFYVKPNYIGRCSHVCNAGFLVNPIYRGMGIGKFLGKQYLTIAPKLGYVYSVFNLVFETNIASSRIWDSLGFDRIGYVKNVAVLKGQDKLVGAYIYGKDLC